MPNIREWLQSQPRPWTTLDAPTHERFARAIGLNVARFKVAVEKHPRQPGCELINVYATVPRKPRGFELEMKVGTNTGWTKDNFHPTGGERLEGILVPWEGSQEKVFLFSESGVTEKVLPVKGARPAPRRAPPRRRR